jgi:DNA polymerase-1
MNKLYLLDAYALIYRAYYALIQKPRINSKGMNTSAIYGFVNTLEEVKTLFSPTHLAVAFDPAGKTFRHEIYEPYKAQRQETPEDIRKSVPVIKDIIRAYNIPILEVEHYEADDVIGTAASRFASADTEVYMLTPDKDYGQLVGQNIWMLRPMKGGTFEKLGPDEINAKYGIDSPKKVIDLLGLMGDSSDNIPGCPGVGEKTAVTLIKQFGGIDALLSGKDQLKGALKNKVTDNEQQILLSRDLATIRTDIPLPFSLDELKLHDIDREEVRKLFSELEFRSLLSRVLGEGKKSARSVQIEGDLFAVNPTEDTEVQKKTNLRGLNSVAHTYKLVEDEEEMRALSQKFLSAKTLSLDTETTGTDAMTAELVGLSFAVEEFEAYYIPVPPEREEAQKIVDIFKPAYENPSSLKTGQNIKYDMLVLARYGVDIKGKMFDTMVAHYVLQPELPHNMDALAEQYLGYSTIKIEELIGPKGKKQKNMRDLPPGDVYEYACEDADVTLRLKNALHDELVRNDAIQLFEEVEMPLVRVLAAMELTGVRIDTETLRETSELFTLRMNKLEEEVFALAGESFNLSSPKQVGEILFDKLKIDERAKRTKTGQYVTSEEVLEKLRPRHEIVDRILNYRGLKKLTSTYVDSLPTLINPSTGKIHTSFNQTVTSTGRLSSSNPNLQNIPVRGDDGKEIRKAFIPEPGCTFFSADYSQIELRIMAHLSGDKHMIEAFLEGDDIHASTAAKIYHKPIGDVTRDERRKAKTANFGIIYGISVFGLAERLNVPRSEARELIDGYFATYPRVREYMDESIERARRQGYIETLLRRRRYLPDINSRNAIVRGYAERNAINAPIQGSAADIIKIAMVRIYNRFISENLRSTMMLQVHDELNFSVVPEEREIVEQIVIHEMENAYSLSVPLKADCGWGANWLEAH